MADLIDRRQRVAACILLSAIDLPAPARETARAWVAAARVCPRISVEEACLGNRRAGLERVAALVAELLAEADG